MKYISLHFTWRILEHERSRWAKERRRQRKRKASAEERDMLFLAVVMDFVLLA
jgi:hypothetical protein